MNAVKHKEKMRAHTVICLLCVGEWVFAIFYLQHGDFLPIYVVIAAFVKERLYEWHERSAWRHREDTVTFAKGVLK